jgi:hypothetical protein
LAERQLRPITRNQTGQPAVAPGLPGLPLRFFQHRLRILGSAEAPKQLGAIRESNPSVRPVSALQGEFVVLFVMRERFRPAVALKQTRSHTLFRGHNLLAVSSALREGEELLELGAGFGGATEVPVGAGERR